MIAGRAVHPKLNEMRVFIIRIYGGRGLIKVEECCAAELRRIYFYLEYSEDGLLKVVASLEKLEKDKIERKRLHQQNRTRKNRPIKKYETGWPV